MLRYAFDAEQAARYTGLYGGQYILLAQKMIRARIDIRVAGCLAILLVAGDLRGADDPSGVLRKRAEVAARRGLDWLAKQQHKRGSWSSPRLPALSGLPLIAFARSEHPQREAVMTRARAFILANVHADGGIYYKAPVSITGGLTTYNTAICMAALAAIEDSELTPVILRARRFIAASQRLDDSDRHGGFGYNRSGRMSRPDLNNTTYAMEAMRLTQHLEDRRAPGVSAVDVEWDAALRFLKRLQSDPAAAGEDAGGFHYNLSEPKAGTVTNKEDVVVLRTYGSMTYSGLLALIYADVRRSDPRVTSAFGWAGRHWTLEENPGMGARGLYFFYYVLSKALRAHGSDQIPMADGTPLLWREELLRTLLALQIVDESTDTGYWTNAQSKKFMEGNAVLVTAYALLALQNALAP